jgi:hypothetical protein
LRGSPQRPKVLLATACAGGLIVILLLVSRLTAAWPAGMLVGVTAGLCHAMNAVFIKFTTADLLGVGVGGTAADWPGYALATQEMYRRGAARQPTSLHFGLDAGLLSRGVLSTLLTVTTIAGCALWGWRRMRQVPGVTFRFA